MKKTLQTMFGDTMKDLVDRLTPKDVETVRRIINRVDKITAEIEAVMHDVKPAAADLRKLVHHAVPVVDRGEALLKDVDKMAKSLGEFSAEKKDELSEIIEHINETAAKLQEAAARIGAFTANVEKKIPDVDPEKIGHTVRQILQKEGLKVNVETVKLWK